MFMLTLLLPVAAAHAGEFSAVINGKSFHVGSTENWNEKNYGLGLEYQLDTQSRWKSILMVNGFRDSEDNLSYMAGAGLHRNLFTSERMGGVYVDVGLNAFVMTRKNINDGRPFPGALPSMTVGNRYIGANLTYLPRVAIREIAQKRTMDKGMRGIFFVQFKLHVAEFLAAR